MIDMTASEAYQLDVGDPQFNLVGTHVAPDLKSSAFADSGTCWK